MVAARAPGSGVTARAPGPDVSSRAVILARIRAANAAAAQDAPAGPVRRAYRQRGELDPAGRLDLLAGRLADYQAMVRRTTADRLADEVAAALARRGARRIVIPAGLDLAVQAPGVEFVPDDNLPAHVLDGCDGVLTTAAVAIAETGTIVLDGSAGQGRRAITLVPDYHLCIVSARQVVTLVGEALAILSPERPLTWISGPSATSDIELERVEGVHGPRTLEVILVEPAGRDPVSRPAPAAPAQPPR